MTRDKILISARALFEEKGYDSTTVREIAAHAGVNVALINYHFGSKDELFTALITEMSNLTQLKLHSISQSELGPEAKLHQTIELLVDKVFSNKKYYKMIYRELSTVQRPELNEKITKILKRNRGEMRAIIEEGQKKKIFRKDIDIDLTLGTMFGLLHQVTNIELKIGTYHEDSNLKPKLKEHLIDMLGSFIIRK